MSTASPVHSRLLGLADNPTYVGRTITFFAGTADPYSGSIQRLRAEGGVLKATTGPLDLHAEDGRRVSWVDHPSTHEFSGQDVVAEVQNNGSVVLTAPMGFRAVIDRTDGPRLTPPPARP